MDNVCHTLVGAACAEAGLKHRTRFGTATLLVAANLPDVDVLVFATELPSVAFRRGWTHGILAQVLLPVVLAAAVMAIDRIRPRQGRAADFRALLLLGYVGVLSHVGLDFLNNYGIRLLMPFSGRWFYGDAVFIIDPWLWAILGAGIAFARKRRRTGPARIALAASTAYIVAMLASAYAARAIVLEEWIRVRGRRPAELMVGPAPVNPFRKTVIAETGDHYVTGTFTWLPVRVTFDAGIVPKNDDEPAVTAARRRDRRIQAVLIWSRFPFYDVAPVPEGTRVTLRDVRFGSRVGGVSVVVPASATAAPGAGDTGRPAR